MTSSEQTDDIEKGSSHVSSLLMSLDSAKDSTYTSLSQSAQYAFQVIRSIKQGRRPDSSWIKLYLEPGDFFLLKERLKVEDDLWDYLQDKIRFEPYILILLLEY